MREPRAKKPFEQCKAKYTSAQIDACNAYADKAVEQAKANDAKKCFTPGPRFSEDRDMHFRWCVGQIETDGVKMVLATKHESDARDAENSACKPVRRLGKLKPGGKNQLRPIPSTGKSPFGAADKSGQSGFNQISNPAGQSAPDKIKSNSVKAAKGGGGFNTAKPSVKPVKSGNTAMDRLGGGDSGAVPSGSAAGAGGRGGARGCERGPGCECRRRRVQHVSRQYLRVTFEQRPGRGIVDRRSVGGRIPRPQMTSQVTSGLRPIRAIAQRVI